MDATRPRRTRDTARQRWYAACRCRRLARLLGFDSPPLLAERVHASHGPVLTTFSVSVQTFHAASLLPKPADDDLVLCSLR
jgi:hypothetical protein